MCAKMKKIVPRFAFIGKLPDMAISTFLYCSITRYFQIFWARSLKSIIIAPNTIAKKSNNFTLRLFLLKSLLNLILLLDHYYFPRAKDYTFFTFLSIVRDLFLLMLNTYSNWIRMTRRGLTLKIEGVTFNHFVFQ